MSLQLHVSDCRVTSAHIKLRMVAEQVHPANAARSNLVRRTLLAGDITLSGSRLTLQTPRGLLSVGLVQRFLIFGFWTLAAVCCAVGSVCLYSMAAADGSPTAGPSEMQQLAGLLQQVLQEQQSQRERIDQLGQAVQGTGAALHGTQQTTEQVIQAVVTQVQAGFQQEQQGHQTAVEQLSQAVQTLQAQVQQIPNAAADQLQQIGQAMQTVQNQMQQQITPGQFQQLTQAFQDLQGQVQVIGQGQTGPAMPQPGAPHGSPPAAPHGSPVGAPPPPFQFGSGATGGVGLGFGAGSSSVSPAVAYALQQGGVDGRALGKPTVFDPTNSKVSFQDWSESIITLSDSSMPGIYECMEWIVTTQPKHSLDLPFLKAKFAHMDQVLLAYAESNVFAILSTYTAGEARSLVRQAKRPNGMEAFRLLQVRFNPTTIGRQRAHLMKITNPQENVALDKLAGEVVAWENRIVDYEARPGAEKVSEAMKMAALIHMSLTTLRQHLQLNAGRFLSYIDLREEVFSYLDQVAPASQATMDIGSLDKSKGCYTCGGPHLQRDCPQGAKGGKSKGKFAKGKNGKDGQKGKGKGKSFGKDAKGGKKGGKKGKGPGVCSNCGKTGHSYESCWSKPKALNSVDPKLAELQSTYAKAALEDYKRISGGASSSGQAPTISILRPPSQPTSPVSPQSVPPAAPVGSLLVRSLCALSRRAMSITESIFGSSAASAVQRHLSRLVASPGQILVTVDSGAAASVCPAGVFDHWPREDGEEGLSFQAADGSIVPELYKVRPLVVTDEGQYRQTQFSVADVNKVLMSAAQVANRGHRIVLQPYYMESYIEDIATGDRMALHQQDGVYVQRLTHVQADADGGFRGQAPDYVPNVL